MTSDYGDGEPIDYSLSEYPDEFRISHVGKTIERYDDFQAFYDDHFKGKDILHFPIVSWNVTPAEFETSYDEDGDGEDEELVCPKMLYLCWVDGPQGVLKFAEIDMDEDGNERAVGDFLADRWRALQQVWAPVSEDA